MKKSPVYVTGVSGAGKTRTVLELLSTRWGIYFCAGNYLSDGPHINPCSRDLAWIAQEGAADGKEAIMANTMRRIKCAVLARLLVLEAAKEAAEEQSREFTVLDWVIMQLYPPSHNVSSDIFEVLTQELYASCSQHCIEYALFISSFLDVCLVVDEAQLAMQQLKNQFHNDCRTAVHPFLFAIIRCLWEIGKPTGICPILSGTEIPVMRMSTVEVSAVAEPSVGWNMTRLSTTYYVPNRW